MDQDRITELLNTAEITSIVNSYFRALDEKNFDARHFASIFTPQATVTRPNGGSLIGPEEISASHQKSFTRFEGSQHFVDGRSVSLDGNTWKISQMRNAVLWRAGGFRDMMQTGTRTQEAQSFNAST